MGTWCSMGIEKRRRVVVLRPVDGLPQQIHVGYRLAVKEFNGTRALQLRLDHWSPLADPGWT